MAAPTGMTNEQRQEAMISAAWRYLSIEGHNGRRSKLAVDEAIAEMIGAASYIRLRLGGESARLAVVRLHDSLIG